MDFVPDYTLAKKQVHEEYFNRYTSAYVVTNEKLRKAMQFVPEKCDNALVVAASGDHPLFCSLYGAKNVDTFDISYNAKCMMDIKVAALNVLGYLEYKSFLQDLYVTCRSNSINITNVKSMDEILQKLSKTESDYISILKNEPLFSRGQSPVASGALPTFFEYCTLRKKIIKPYNFFLTGISKLETHLEKSYDFVHLSNIFDYVSEGSYADLLLPLMQHLNPGGRIVLENFDDDCSFGLDYMERKILSNVNNSFVLKKSKYLHILERIR
jgi:hypothetical protein